MAGRDPAFLYYDADVALDVAHMTRLEKGCYLDLVQLYRRYHGYTMVQIRYILGNDFDMVWNALSLVLILEGEKYHIQWLRNSLDKKAERNKKQRENIQKRWNKEKEKPLSDQNGNTMVLPPNNRGSTNVLPVGDNGNSIVIPIIVTETETETETKDDVRGVGEEEGGGKEGFSDWKPPEAPPWPERASQLPQAMLKIFIDSFPGYPRQKANDLPACLQIAYAIAEMHGWTWQSALNERMDDILAEWQKLVFWVASDSWYRKKPLSFLNSNFQGLIQAKNDTGNDKQPNRTRNAPNLTATGSPVVQTFVGGTSRKPWRD